MSETRPEPEDENVENEYDGEQPQSDDNPGRAQEIAGHFPVPKRSLSDLVNPPRHLGTMRQALFEVRGKLELSVEDFEQYWPYVDNVWVRQHKAGPKESKKNVTDYYACRLQRPTYTPKDIDKPKPEGRPTRKKHIREGGKCQMKIKTIRWNGGYSSYTITQVGDPTEHAHDLDHMDKIKRNTVLMDMARSEVMKGYMPPSVHTVMCEDTEKLLQAGGRYLSRNDVRNASAAWRQLRREPLQVHEGYTYDQRNGILKHDENAPVNPFNARLGLLDPTLSGSTAPPPNTIHFPEESRAFLESYLPPIDLPAPNNGLPHVTLTYATSMDSSLALAPGTPTAISGPEAKAMTHYLRSRHDAILIGVNTVIADDPALNCRLEGVGGFGGIGWEGQPRPVIIDPGARWAITAESKLLAAVREGRGRGPWVIMAPGFALEPARMELLRYYGGRYFGLADFDTRWRLKWEVILKALAAEGIRSVMVEGGGMVINDLLLPEHTHIIKSVIITKAPMYLGRGGVVVSPIKNPIQLGKAQPVVRFKDVKWQPLGEDVVMCGRIKADAPANSLPSASDLNGPAG